MTKQPNAANAPEAALTQTLMQTVARMKGTQHRRRSSVEIVQQTEADRFERGRSPTVRPYPWEHKLSHPKSQMVQHVEYAPNQALQKKP